MPQIAFSWSPLSLDIISPNGDDTDVVRAENEALNQTWYASNGFLKRSTADLSGIEKAQPKKASLGARHQYRHFRNDVLQACRPRNRGDYGSGLPVSLVILLKKATKGSADTSDDHWQKSKLGRDSMQRLASAGDAGCLTPQRMHTSRSKYPLEWGAVNFDELNNSRLNSSHQLKLNRSFSGSQSSPSSSFTSIGHGSHRFPSQLLGSHLQSTTSLEGGEQSASSGGGDQQMPLRRSHHSDSSMDEEISSPGKGPSIPAIQKLMSDYDKCTFTNSPKPTQMRNCGPSPRPNENDIRNSFNDAFR